MASFVDVPNGNGDAHAFDIQQVIDVLKGTSGKGIPVALTAVNDPINYALAVKNNDSSASKAFAVFKADGTILFQIDKNGVVASPDGTAGASQIPTLTGTQTLTNKTLTSPILNTPTLNTATENSPTIVTPTFTGVVKGQTGWFDPVMLVRI